MLFFLSNVAGRIHSPPTPLWRFEY